MTIDDRCQACGDEGESINHILFSCHVARQAWALSSIPHPKGGFHSDSIYANFDYLFNLDKRRNLRKEDSRVWPWIIWNLWKRRNDMLFEGRCYEPAVLVLKANRDAVEWFMAQDIEEGWKQEEKARQPVHRRNWNPPKKGWKMCNVGVDFDKTKRVAGGAWVLQNERGVVLIHSRRSFAGINSKEEAKCQVLLWSTESMKSQRQTHVIFAGEFEEFFGAVQRPDAWPSLLYQGTIIREELLGLEVFELKVVTRKANRGAVFIAQSVKKMDLVHSYVATGHPDWLFEFFVNESRDL
ncbi:hypothetical protein Bca52824_032627 [Brassica carinata]|uniref:Reverse transcriptase zinc-binding domain-containing protein n=1 Tax=Brassica carinata TaxID=52824 RepID=A0A8X7V7Q9_BRACI|nr:hypothetical protein Bca52824_032627 [Brassica carinata]